MIGAPAPDEEVPWYGDGNRAMVDALRGRPVGEVIAELTAAFAAFPLDPEAVLELSGVGRADAAVLTPPVRERLRASLVAATAQGLTGMVADLAGYTLADWGFAPSQVTADVLLAYGADDELVPPDHGEWYRAQLPSAELEVWPEVGHLVVVPAWGRVLDHLTEAAAAESTTYPKGEGGVRHATPMQLRRA